MGLPAFLARNWVFDDGVTFDGGSWVFPLSALASFDPLLTAQSSDATNASTIVEIDLGAGQTCNYIGYLFANLSENARIRYTLSNDPTFATYELQTDWLDAYPSTQPFGQGAFGVFSFGGFAAQTERDERGVSHHLFLAAALSVQYIRIEVDDESNSDGYAEVGVVWAGFMERPSSGIRDITVTPVTVAVVNRTQAGTLHLTPQYMMRRIDLTLQHETQDVMLPVYYEMGRQNMLRHPILFFLDPTDSMHLARTGIYGVVADPPRLQYLPGTAKRYSLTLAIEEV